MSDGVTGRHSVTFSDKTDTGNALVETFLSAQNVNLHPQKLNVNVAAVKARHADGVLFRGDDQFGSGGFRIVDKVDHLLLAVAVVVGKMTLQNQFAAEFLKEKLKARRFCHRGDGSDRRHHPRGRFG